MATPLCNGQRIVILGNVTMPDMYEDAIQQLLVQDPGASYLRTDQSCPSLRQADDEGDPIYAVYRYAGTADAQARSAVCAAGSGAYGKRLDYTTDTGFLISC
jgi:serine/threonine-protein kinase